MKVSMPQLPSHIDRATQEFSDIRRQCYLYWEAYEAILASIDKIETDTIEWTRASSPKKKLSLGYITGIRGLFEDAMERISLEYTAGAPIDELKGLYPAAVDAFEAWCFAYRDWSFHKFSDVRKEYEAENKTPCDIELNVATDFLELLRLLSLGILFKEDAQLRRIAKLIQPLRRKDTVIEELLMVFVPDSCEINGYFHVKLYGNLMSASWSDDPQESAQFMNKFLNAWYKYFDGASWHNAHLRFGKFEDAPNWANYYGYFAWEAAAMVYLYDLDDSAYRDHLLYPKDLVDWAFKQGKAPKSYVPDSLNLENAVDRFEPAGNPDVS
jgi:hypothetical protein